MIRAGQYWIVRKSWPLTWIGTSAMRRCSCLVVCSPNWLRRRWSATSSSGVYDASLSGLTSWSKSVWTRCWKLRIQRIFPCALSFEVSPECAVLAHVWIQFLDQVVVVLVVALSVFRTVPPTKFVETAWWQVSNLSWSPAAKSGGAEGGVFSYHRRKHHATLTSCPPVLSALCFPSGHNVVSSFVSALSNSRFTCVPWLKVKESIIPWFFPVLFFSFFSLSTDRHQSVVQHTLDSSRFTPGSKQALSQVISSASLVETSAVILSSCNQMVWTATSDWPTCSLSPSLSTSALTHLIGLIVLQVPAPAFIKLVTGSCWAGSSTRCTLTTLSFRLRHGWTCLVNSYCSQTVGTSSHASLARPLSKHREAHRENPGCSTTKDFTLHDDALIDTVLARDQHSLDVWARDLSRLWCWCLLTFVLCTKIPTLLVDTECCRSNRSRQQRRNERHTETRHWSTREALPEPRTWMQTVDGQDFTVRSMRATNKNPVEAMRWAVEQTPPVKGVPSQNRGMAGVSVEPCAGPVVQRTWADLRNVTNRSDLEAWRALHSSYNPLCRGRQRVRMQDQVLMDLPALLHQKHMQRKREHDGKYLDTIHAARWRQRQGPDRSRTLWWIVANLLEASPQGLCVLVEWEPPGYRTSRRRCRELWTNCTPTESGGNHAFHAHRLHWQLHCFVQEVAKLLHRICNLPTNGGSSSNVTVVSRADFFTFWSSRLYRPLHWAQRLRGLPSVASSGADILLISEHTQTPALGPRQSDCHHVGLDAQSSNAAFANTVHRSEGVSTHASDKKFLCVRLSKGICFCRRVLLSSFFLLPSFFFSHRESCLKMKFF